MKFPVSVKAVIEVDGRVPLLRNERSEWELPGERLELGEDLDAAVEILVCDCALRITVAAEQPLLFSPEQCDARWFDVTSLAAVEMPELYRRSIRRAAGSRR